MKVLVIINPSAGSGRAKKVFARVRRVMEEEGVGFDAVFSLNAQDITAQAAQAQGYDRVLVIGGDGSLHWAMNGLVGASMPLGFVPGGRGNDFAKNIGLSPDPEGALRSALYGPVKKIDVVRAGKRCYMGVGGLGFDAEVAEFAQLRVPLLKGTLAYLAALCYKLVAFKAKEVVIEHDHGVYEGRVMLVAFGNDRSYGGGMLIAPQAVMDDGLIDLVIVEEISVADALVTLPRVYTGSHLSHPAVKTLRTTRATVRCEEPLKFMGDGEPITTTPLELEILPASLNMAVPTLPLRWRA